MYVSPAFNCVKMAWVAGAGMAVGPRAQDQAVREEAEELQAERPQARGEQEQHGTTVPGSPLQWCFS